jgi:hypothetical protein
MPANFHAISFYVKFQMLFLHPRQLDFNDEAGIGDINIGVWNPNGLT